MSRRIAGWLPPASPTCRVREPKIVSAESSELVQRQPCKFVVSGARASCPPARAACSNLFALRAQAGKCSRFALKRAKMPALHWRARMRAPRGKSRSLCPRSFQQLHARINCLHVWQSDSQLLAKFNHSSRDRFQLCRLAGLNVLEHRRPVMTNFFGAFQPLFDRHPDIYSKLLSDSFSFLHNRGGERARLFALNNFDQRCPSQRADWIVGNVAHQLDPEVMSYVGANGTPQTRLDKRVGDPATSLTLRAVGLADRESISLRVPNYTRLDDFGRGIDDTADHAGRIDVLTNDAARINALDAGTFQLSAMTIEVPPGKTVLSS